MGVLKWLREEPKAEERVVSSYPGSIAGPVVHTRDGIEPLALAAVGASASITARLFGSAEVEATGPASKQINAEFLSRLAYAVVLDGAWWAEIVIDGLGLRLIPLQEAVVRTGGPTSESWSVDATQATPMGRSPKVLSYASCVRIPWAVSPYQPWVDISPWQSGATTVGLLAAMERSLNDEAGQVTGQVLPLVAGGLSRKMSYCYV